MSDDRMTDRKVEIIPGCIVCKTCEFTCPDVFEVPEKGLMATVVDPHPPAELRSQLMDAIRDCPENVIKFKKVESGA